MINNVTWIKFSLTSNNFLIKITDEFISIAKYPNLNNKLSSASLDVTYDDIHKKNMNFDGKHWIISVMGLFVGCFDFFFEDRKSSKYLISEKKKRVKNMHM